MPREREMTTDATWIVSDLGEPPAHPSLKARYEEARQAGAAVRVFRAAPPPVAGGLQQIIGVETLVVSGRAWQASGHGRVAEGAWDEPRRRLRLANGRERDLYGRIHRT
jgi:hypothetical protein